MTNFSEDMQRIAEERAIERLILSYGHALDFGSADEVASLFTPEGSIAIQSVWVSPEDGSAAIPYETEGLASGAVREKNALVWRGAAAIRQFVAGGASDKRTLHVCSQVIVTRIAGDEAAADSYMRVYAQAEGESPMIVTFGRYRDVLRRMPEGWKLHERVCEVG